MHSSTDIDFLRINSQPIQQAMSTWITKWVYMFTSYLQNHLTDKLYATKQFMDRIFDGLSGPIQSDNQDRLMEAMTHIRDVRKAMTETQESFGPMRDTMALMRNHGIDMSAVMIGDEDADEPIGAIEFLEEVPMLWDNTVNLAFKKKRRFSQYKIPWLRIYLKTLKSLLAKLNDFALCLDKMLLFIPWTESKSVQKLLMIK